MHIDKLIEALTIISSNLSEAEKLDSEVDFWTDEWTKVFLCPSPKLNNTDKAKLKELGFVYDKEFTMLKHVF